MRLKRNRSWISPWILRIWLTKLLWMRWEPKMTKKSGDSPFVILSYDIFERYMLFKTCPKKSHFLCERSELFIDIFYEYKITLLGRRRYFPSAIEKGHSKTPKFQRKARRSIPQSTRKLQSGHQSRICIQVAWGFKCENYQRMIKINYPLLQQRSLYIA